MAMRVATLLLLCWLHANCLADPGVVIQPGVTMPYLSLGTGSGQKGDVANATALWIQAGGVGIDTAYNYDDEQEIAQGIAHAHASAHSLFVTTKIPCSNYETASKHIKDNLVQLKMTKVDLMLIHSPSLLCGISETWRALEDAKASGLIRAIGVSNFEEQHLKTLAKTQREAPVLNQCSLSVSYHDDKTIGYCKQQGITYMAFSPLCGGANGSSCPHGSVLTIPEVQAIARSHNVSTAQVALKWIVQQGHPVTCAAWRQDYMKEDLDLWSWGELSQKEMQTLANVQAGLPES